MHARRPAARRKPAQERLRQQRVGTLEHGHGTALPIVGAAPSSNNFHMTIITRPPQSSKTGPHFRGSVETGNPRMPWMHAQQGVSQPSTRNGLQQGSAGGKIRLVLWA